MVTPNNFCVLCFARCCRAGRLAYEPLRPVRQCRQSVVVVLSRQGGLAGQLLSRRVGGLGQQQTSHVSQLSRCWQAPHAVEAGGVVLGTS